ncbi:MAG: hydrogenase expression/formation protein HypE [Acidobacteriia bacterium]|nr:hydrogenase expression/formation protein HypE [Terriglobia bacterium]
MSTLTFNCPVPLIVRDHVSLGHGSGGKLSAELMRDIFLPAFRNETLERLEDQATLTLGNIRIALTTDSFVVKPLFFPGGDIGSLAVHGTVNDLAMGGATPLFLSAAFIIEEGFSMESLRRISASLGRAATACGVQVVTGDTKVVDKGSGDGVFINTTGLGVMPEGVHLSAGEARPGDAVILSGFIGDHGIAILAEREGIEFDSPVESDSAPLHTLVADMLGVTHAIRCLRDPTRGGVSSSLNEIAAQSRVGIQLEETTIPVREEVRGACEMLGLDPLYVANEGKLLAIVDPAVADNLVDVMRKHPLGREARRIGTVKHTDPGWVTMRTVLGTTRIVDMLAGDQLPRIC